MAFPSTYENIKQVPLTPTFSCRDATLTSDAYLFNGFLEKATDGAYSVKRPGLKTIVNLPTGAGVFGGAPVSLPNYTCQGVFRLGNVVAALIGGYSVTFSGLQTSTDQLVGTTVLPAGNPSDCVYRGLSTLYSSSSTYYVQGPTYLLRLNSSAVITVPNTTPMVPSLCELDGTFYVMETNGTIWASALLDGNTWPVLNFVGVLFGQPAVCLYRHLTYLLAFSQDRMKVYYDAGISPGAPIAEVTSSGGPFGMPVTGALTIQSTESTTIWLGRSSTAGFVVYAMSGLSVQKISTPEIERVLNSNFEALEAWQGSGSYLTAANAARGSLVRESGHTFYVLTCPTVTQAGTLRVTGVSLVFDLTTHEWHVWDQKISGDGQQELQFFGILPENGLAKNLAVSATSGKVYMLDANTYQDDGQPVNFAVQTELVSWGNQRMKMIPATYILSDTLASNLTISWTDNDYMTFNTPQVVSTATTKKQLIRCGSTVQRAWKLVHTDNTPMRLYNLEVEVQAGAL